MYYFYYRQLQNVLSDYVAFLERRNSSPADIAYFFMYRWGYIFPELSFSDWLGVYNEFLFRERGVSPDNFATVPYDKILFFDKFLRKKINKKCKDIEALEASADDPDPGNDTEYFQFKL